MSRRRVNKSVPLVNGTAALNLFEAFEWKSAPRTAVHESENMAKKEENDKQLPFVPPLSIYVSR